MKKVEGVSSVVVSLKEGTTSLELRDGNTVTLAQLRNVIKNNGFVSRNASVTARGTLSGDVFEVRLTKERLHILGKAVSLEDDRWRIVVPAK